MMNKFENNTVVSKEYISTKIKEINHKISLLKTYIQKQEILCINAKGMLSNNYHPPYKLWEERSVLHVYVNELKNLKSELKKWNTIMTEHYG